MKMVLRVEKRTTLFGFTIRDWHTATKYNPRLDCSFLAIFGTLDEAKIFCGIPVNPIIHESIVEEV